METAQKQKPFLSSKPQRTEHTAMTQNQSQKKNPPPMEELRKLLERSSSAVRANAKSNASYQTSPPKVPALPALTRIGEDGYDHINFSSAAESQLGKALALTNNLDFKHELAGHFQNIDCFWHYVKSRDDDPRLRFVPQYVLRKLVRDIPMVENVPNFFAIIADAMYSRIVAYPEVVAVLNSCDLPMDYYKYPGDGQGAAFRPSIAQSLIRCMEVIRKAIKNGYEPNFHEFLDQNHRLPAGASGAEKQEHAKLMIRRRFITEQQDAVLAERAAEKARRLAEQAKRREENEAEQSVAELVEGLEETVATAETTEMTIEFAEQVVANNTEARGTFGGAIKIFEEDGSSFEDSLPPVAAVELTPEAAEVREEVIARGIDAKAETQTDEVIDGVTVQS